MQRQRGFSLLEVLIAAVLLATALLAHAALAARSLHTAAMALDQQVATVLLTDLRGRVQLIAREGTGPTPGGVVEAVFADWQEQVRLTLPDGRSSLCVGDAPVGTPIPAAPCPSTQGFEARLQWRRFPNEQAQRRRLAWSP